MKRWYLCAVILSLSVAIVAQDNHKKDNNDHSAQGSQQSQNQSEKHEKDDHETDEHGRKHMKFTQEGAFASVSDNSIPKFNFNLSVSRGSSSTLGTSTFMQFTSFQISDDNNTQTVTIIFGEIPNAAFIGSDTSNLALNLDTSTLDPAVSSSQTCIINANPLSVSCTSGPLGLMHMAFHENGLQATKILNHVEEDIVGPVTTLIRSSSDNGSADVQGSLLGVPVASSSATVGVNHSSSIEITRH